MRCPNCGSYEADDAIACSKCGADLPIDGSGSNSNTYNPYSVKPGNSPYAGNSGNSPYSGNQSNAPFMGSAGSSDYEPSGYNPYEPQDKYGKYDPNKDAVQTGAALKKYKRKGAESRFSHGFFRLVLLLVFIGLVFVGIKTSGFLGMDDGEYVCDITEGDYTVEMTLSVDDKNVTLGVTGIKDKNGTSIDESSSIVKAALESALPKYKGEYKLEGTTVKLEVKLENDETLTVDKETIEGKYNWFKKTVKLNVEEASTDSDAEKTTKTYTFKYKD